ncbi:Ribosomal large subunit pseudouridine synthase D [Acaryochloris thomasi RCC1774]|uniref:Pseudouridine synthase n=1 Tax=Acaryochloris thomasi RCC1774 TaxID=1764569 RepID=A0A2W1K136_9CYAN|nr:RluA family pseudouridine synthase [Acaryochloris thomasi]PZD75204.1 Ribosomal large subunit pseudouridine synthase D [Acaryochloris thomasi RCC1774]
MNQGWVYHDCVNRAASGVTLLDYYAQRYRRFSAQDWRSRIENGQVCVEGNPGTVDTVVQAGQKLTYHRPPWQEPEAPLSFEVLYEDEDLLAIAKPSGLPVLPGGGFLEHTLLHLLRKRYPKETPVPVHRLGRGTSGLVLLARSALARSELSREIRDRKLQKIYRALIGPCDLPEQLTIEQPIDKIPHPFLGHIYSATPSGKYSRSDVQVLQRTDQSTLVEVSILTGRPHQIRIHLAAVGFPLLGDPLYGIGGVPSLETQAVPGDCGYHLHASRLGFVHPRTQESVAIECLPPDLLCMD